MPPNETPTKQFDVFISYSSDDRDIARRLFEDLRGRGFTAWWDENEILVGHNIVDEVFRGIRESHFLAIILTPASVSSAWVREELTSAKTREIQEQRVAILPVLADNCEVPEPIQTLRYADFREHWEEGLSDLCAAIEQHRYTSAVESAQEVTSTPSRPRGQTCDWTVEYLDLLSEISEEHGSPPGMEVKDVVVGPGEGTDVQLDRRDLRPLIEDNEIRIQGYGGAAFPYGWHPHSVEHRLQDGILIVDRHAWPSSSESFNLWRLDTDGKFMQRTDITEDNIDYEELQSDNKYLSIEWALLDIVRPILFGRRLLEAFDISSVCVSYRWTGLDDRSLLVLNRQRRHGFFQDYTSHVDLWRHGATVTPSSELFDLASDATESLFWHFGWDRAGESAVPGDLETLVSGVFPR